jgi:hypothetical protein
MKYEYRLIHIVVYANGDINLGELNEAGKDGWEAVNVSPWNSPPFVVLMKREVNEETKAKEPEPQPEPVAKPKGKRNRYET